MVADIITPLFHHDGFLDVVPSDVVAGIILVRIQQRAYKAPSSESQPSSSPSSSVPKDGGIEVDIERGVVPDPTPSVAAKDHDYNFLFNTRPSARKPDYHRLTGYKHRHLAQSIPLTPSHEGDFASLKEISHYAKYSLALYTHLLYLYLKPMTGGCKLCFYSSRHLGCCKRKLFDFGVDGDNSCSMNQVALVRFTRKLKSKCIFATFENSSRARPYAVFADAARRTVVISIRGTLSLEDCLTDLNAQVETFLFEDKEVSAHRGMLRSAQHILQDLESRNLIQKAVASLEIGYQSPHQPPDSYQLVVTGHSLGAGAAVLLTFLLKAKYPHVQCYSFGTPGSCVDRTTAAGCRDFVTSVCLGSDIVCRLSIRSLSLLREEILDAISRAKVNKMQIIQSLVKEYEADELLLKTAPETEFKRVMMQYNEKMLAEVARLNPVPLYIPGKIIHFAKFRTEGHCCTKRKMYAPQYTYPEEFEEIHVSPTMVWDHMPDRYVEEIDNVLEQWVRHDQETNRKCMHV